MGEIKVSQMTETENVNDSDLMMVIQDNTNKKVKVKNIKKQLIQDDFPVERYQEGVVQFVRRSSLNNVRINRYIHKIIDPQLSEGGWVQKEVDFTLDEATVIKIEGAVEAKNGRVYPLDGNSMVATNKFFPSVYVSDGFINYMSYNDSFSSAFVIVDVIFAKI